MNTTTMAAFWEGIASTSGTMITGNTTFWILLGQVLLIFGVIGALAYAFIKAVKIALGMRNKGRKR